MIDSLIVYLDSLTIGPGTVTLLQAYSHSKLRSTAQKRRQQGSILIDCHRLPRQTVTRNSWGGWTRQKGRESVRPYLRPITLGRGRPIVVARRRVITMPTSQISLKSLANCTHKEQLTARFNCPALLPVYLFL